MRGREGPAVLVISSSPAHEVEDRVRAAGAQFLRKGAPRTRSAKPARRRG